jgi:hypothetical protein
MTLPILTPPTQLNVHNAAFQLHNVQNTQKLNRFGAPIIYTKSTTACKRNTLHHIADLIKNPGLKVHAQREFTLLYVYNYR